MDSQLKRGLLEICVLKVISHEDSYGYQIVKDVEPHLEISESTLYPILRRLENSGSLEVYSREYSGRLRKYYRITEEGKTQIKEFIKDWKKVMEVIRYISEGVKTNGQE